GGQQFLTGLPLPASILGLVLVQPFPCGRTGGDDPIGVLGTQRVRAPVQIAAGIGRDTGDACVTVRSTAQVLGSARACLCSCLGQCLLSAVVESATFRPGANGSLCLELVVVPAVPSRQAFAGLGCDRCARATDGGTCRGECLGFEGAL